MKVKVTSVSYLNAKPFMYGIFKQGIESQLELDLSIPSISAQKLIDGEVDLGLVPVATIPFLKEAHIISDYCIGSVGQVKTVAIFAERPLEEITHLYLDFHSKTSVALTKVLLKEYWNLEPVLLEAKEGYIEQIKGRTAGLIIGDRAIGMDTKYDYVYDLGLAWEAHTGLPFVFAAWVSNKPLEAQFVQDFNAALKSGLNAIDELAYILPTPSNGFDIQQYFTKYISYDLDAEKQRALTLFLQKINSPIQPHFQLNRPVLA